jgi:16S rRNA (guanine966-N2)-methyltransferase
MRIIAGRHRGRVLTSPTWPGLRPTSDRLRETLFNILAPRLPGARVLDVCAGTGAVALEALSRGAASAMCIESNRRAQALIATNRDTLGEGARCIILSGDALPLMRGALAGGPFDVIFLDPPYDTPALDDLVGAAARHLAPEGILVVEHASRRASPLRNGEPPTRTVRAGDSTLAFYS